MLCHKIPPVDQQINISIAGLGIIFYSPFAVTHISDGEDYLESHFWDPEMVAQHVMECQISAFGTGSPGEYQIRLIDGVRPDETINSAIAAIRLGSKSLFRVNAKDFNRNRSALKFRSCAPTASIGLEKGSGVDN